MAVPAAELPEARQRRPAEQPGGWDPGDGGAGSPTITACFLLLTPFPQSGSGQRSQGSSIPQKSQANKSAYNSYSWGAN